MPGAVRDTGISAVGAIGLAMISRLGGCRRRGPRRRQRLVEVLGRRLGSDLCIVTATFARLLHNRQDWLMLHRVATIRSRSRRREDTIWDLTLRVALPHR